MSDRNIGEGGRGRRSEPEHTRDMSKWRESIAKRDRIYAVSYRQAVDYGKSPEDARAIARDAFLRSFDSTPEVMLTVALDSNLQDGQE